MDNQQVDLENLTQQDFLEIARYVAITENMNRQLLEQLREAKAGLLATVQQRNALNAKLQNILMERANTINIESVPLQTMDLTNPEMYAVPEGKVSIITKSDKI
jgi:hypothetical protein